MFNSFSQVVLEGSSYWVDPGDQEDGGYEEGHLEDDDEGEEGDGQMAVENTDDRENGEKTETKRRGRRRRLTHSQEMGHTQIQTLPPFADYQSVYTYVKSSLEALI